VPEESTVGGIDVDVLAVPPRVALTGQVDCDGARELSNVLRGLLAMGHTELVLDLGRVTGLDPAVPLVLADVSSRGLELRLQNLPPALQELLHVEAS